MPRSGAPTGHASARSNSTSADAFERLPSLSFSRLMRIALRSPSGFTRGIRKQPRPARVCASTRCASHCGAEKNHLWPVMRHAPPASGSARVTLARTSDPPWRSVMPMPISAARFCADGQRARIVVGRQDPRHPASAPALPARAARSTGTLRIRHRQRALRAVLDLRVQVVAGGARSLRAGLRRAPRRAMLAGFRREPHQRVPRRMKHDLVDALAATIVRAQHGDVAIRGIGERVRVRRAECAPHARSCGTAHCAASRVTASRNAMSTSNRLKPSNAGG